MANHWNPCRYDRAERAHVLWWHPDVDEETQTLLPPRAHQRCRPGRCRMVPRHRRRMAVRGKPTDRRTVTRVEWSPEDGEYVATDERYPSLSWLDDSPEGAALGLDTLIRDIEEGRA